MDEQLLVSKRSAAAMLGLSVRTLENLISLKELPARRIGRRCLIERTTLERFARRDHRTKQKANQHDTALEAGEVRDEQSATNR
jgi:excisionase family DNA binding protein